MADTIYAARLAALRAALAEAGHEALLVSQAENRAYLSGFTGSAGWLLISQTQALLATDFRYYEQVGQESPAFALVKLPAAFSAALPEMIAAVGVGQVAFEADSASYADVQAWAAATPQVAWTPTSGLVLGRRATKDASELAVIRRAIALADDALAAALAQARVGMTELDLSWLIESYMRTHDASGVSFELIVACGPNGARPHARASAAPLVAGEPIVIDIGARLDGYCSDLTRTVCLGQPNDPERFWAVYNTVLRAQEAAEAAIGPGMSGADAHGIAHEVIAAAGYGDYFGHGLGHGVGLAIHESPRLSRLSTDTLQPGHVVTVEPGIYLPGWGGVRIEDMVFITETGAEVVTRAPKDPILPLATW